MHTEIHRRYNLCENTGSTLWPDSSSSTGIILTNLSVYTKNTKHFLSTNRKRSYDWKHMKFQSYRHQIQQQILHQIQQQILLQILHQILQNYNVSDFLVFIFATQWRRPYTFQRWNSIRSNNQSLKYQSLAPSGCNNTGIRKFEFVWRLNSFCRLFVSIDWVSQISKLYNCLGE